MPISLALRGRHAGDAVGPRPGRARSPTLHEVDAVFSTYRADSFISRLDRGEIELADCPPEVARGARARRSEARVESGGAFDVRRPARTGARPSTPTGS